MAVPIEIIRPREPGVGMLPALCLNDFAVAVLVPVIPVVRRTCRLHFILCLVVASNDHLLVHIEVRAAARSGHVSSTTSHCHQRLSLGGDMETVSSLSERAHGDVRGIDLDLRITLPERHEVGETLRKL